MRTICTIADLEDVNAEYIIDYLKNHSFDEEIKKWSLEAGKKGVYHANKLEWNRPRLKKVFHPSAISDDCEFKLFLDLWGAKYSSRQSSGLQMIFDTGTAVHGQLDYLFETHAASHKYEFKSEVGFKPTYIKDTTSFKGEVKKWVENTIIDKLRMSGHVDGVMERVFRIRGKAYLLRIVFEFKTISKSGYNKLSSKPQLPHRKQVHAYMKCLDIPLAVIVYINKDNSNCTAFPISFDSEFWQPLGDRLLAVKGAFKHRKEPDKKEGGSCRMCGYFDVCGPCIPKRKRSGYGAPKL